MNSTTKILVLPVNGKSYQKSLDIVEELRQNGFQAKFSGRVRRLDSKLKEADEEGIPIVIIVGPKEIKQGKIVLRLMNERKQILVKICDLLEKLRILLEK